MNNKLIFLGIEGVLTSYRTYLAYNTTMIDRGDCSVAEYNWDRVSLRLIKNITESYDASLVIHSELSTDHSPEDFIKVLGCLGWVNAPVVGTTGLEDNKPKEVIDFCTEYRSTFPLEHVAIIDSIQEHYNDCPLFPDHTVITNTNIGFGVHDFRNTEHVLQRFVDFDTWEDWSEQFD